MKKIFILIVFALLVHLMCAFPIYGNISQEENCISLDHLNQIIKDSKASHLLICGDNNIAVEITPDMLQWIDMIKNDSQISFQSDSLPPVCSINNIKYIAINNCSDVSSLSILDDLSQIDWISPYDFIIRNSELLGTQEKNLHIAKKYSINDQWPLMDEINQQKLKKIMTVDVYGTETIHENVPKLSFDMNHFSLNSKKIALLWSNYPEMGLTDIYQKQVESVKANKTLALFIDGLGYHNLLNYYARRNITQPSLGFIPTRSIIPSVTKYASFTLGSGKYYRSFQPEKIYQDPCFEGGIIIEEEKVYHQANIELLLNTDRNENGTIDDEIFKELKKRINKDYPFIMTHFHSIDDYSHQYGPFHPLTLERIDKVMEYIDYCVAHFDGNIVIYSDHGQHNVFNKGGDHGSARAQDMIGVFYYVEKE